MHIQHWQDIASRLLGVWLVVSSFVLGFAGAATWITIVLGLFIILFAVEGFVIPSYLEEWGELLLGLALLVAPWTVGYESVSATVSSLASGILVILFAAWELMTDRDLTGGTIAGITRSPDNLMGRVNASEEDATEVKAQNEQDQSDVDPCLTNDIDGHAKPDQHGRGRCDFGRSSAHPPGRQAFLRRRGFAYEIMEQRGSTLGECRLASSEPCVPNAVNIV
jgi:hypothetical protein